MGNFGAKEILLLVFILVILFGAKRIPELMRGLGRGVKEFKDGMSDGNKGEDRPEKKP